MDANVWLVTQGEYSDYGVVGVFSTKEKAEAYVASHNAAQGGYFKEDGTFEFSYASEARIEEYPLDDFAPVTPAAWEAYFWWPEGYSRGHIAVVEANGTLLDGDEIRRNPDGKTRLTFARPSREHAHRAAREMWRALKAGTFTLDAVPFTSED